MIEDLPAIEQEKGTIFRDHTFQTKMEEGPLEEKGSGKRLKIRAMPEIFI